MGVGVYGEWAWWCMERGRVGVWRGGGEVYGEWVEGV